MIEAPSTILTDRAGNEELWLLSEALLTVDSAMTPDDEDALARVWTKVQDELGLKVEDSHIERSTYGKIMV